jgi:hypothetical protein
MPDLASTLTSALQDAARAGASAASSAGRDLADDVERFIVPKLQGIAIDVADIFEKQQSGIFSADIAQSELESQCGAVMDLIRTVATLIVEEVQQIYNAIIGALSAAANKAIGLSLLPV